MSEPTVKDLLDSLKSDAKEAERLRTNGNDFRGLNNLIYAVNNFIKNFPSIEKVNDK